MINKGGRPRKGTLEFRSGSWHARLTLGVGIRKWVNLDTDNEQTARAKMRSLVVRGSSVAFDPFTVPADLLEAFNE